MSPSAAATVLQARALQCSFSSVFHLQKAGVPTAQAKFIEHMFVAAVGGPLALLGLSGLVLPNHERIHYHHDDDNIHDHVQQTK